MSSFPLFQKEKIINQIKQFFQNKIKSPFKIFRRLFEIKKITLAPKMFLTNIAAV